jgi:hypothetical protein
MTLPWRTLEFAGARLRRGLAGAGSQRDNGSDDSPAMCTRDTGDAGGCERDDAFRGGSLLWGSASGGASRGPGSAVTREPARAARSA